MSGVPYTFATATTSIPLSQLDVNFATPATLGNTTVGLGNTVTSVGNLTLTNATISSLASQLGAAAMPTGSVIQVVTSTTTTNTNTTSTSYVTTTLSASITPQFSTSTIFVITDGAADTGTSGEQATFTLYRNNTTNLGNGSTGIVNIYSSASRVIGSVGMVYLDSPSTTSSTTYTVYMKTSGGNSINFPQQQGKTTITLMEIR
jgi:hypothetical protein